MNISFIASAIRLNPGLGLLFLALFDGQAVQAQDSFTRITAGPAVSGVNSTILAWGDFNNDGFQDLFVSTRTGPSLLYSNNGNGTFSQVLTGPVVADSGNCFGATWGDYDNDGFLDLFVGVNSSGNDWLYHNNGHGGFTKVTTGAIVNSGGNANNSCWADYDNDGFLDLFVANSDQNDFLYHNNGDGTFARITTNAIALKMGNSQGGSWADYDNDGLPDLFVSRVNEPNLLYHNEGHGFFTPVTNGIIVHDVSIGQGTSWGDYDNDGYLDLFVVNPNARNFLYHNNGDGTFTKITNGAIITDIGNGHGCGWADYDNDGHLDLFVANRLGANFLYHNNGDGTFTRVTTGVVPTDVADASSAAWADYDNDGFPDLFVTELNSFNNRLYRNNGTSNAWITLNCEGRVSNRAALGAKARVKAAIGGKVIWQLREISGGGGLGSQNDLRASFGLGDATKVEVIRLEWPSGLVQELTNLAVRQFLTVIEPEAHISPAHAEVEAGTRVMFTLTTTLPPPLNVQWRFNGVALPGQTNAALVVTNTQAGDLGRYTVTLANPKDGFVFTPPPAILSGAVTITQPPLPQYRFLGSNATFLVVASGFGPLGYQWQFNGGNLPGATNDTLMITNLQMSHQGTYSVAVSNSYGVVVSSNAALGVLIKPVITLQPLSQSVVAGGSVTFSVSVAGNPPPFGFRWRKDGATVTNFALNTATCFFTVTNIQPIGTNTSISYGVVVSNAASFGVLSSNAVLTVLADTDGDSLPDDWEIAHGLDATNAADAAMDSDGDGLTNLQEYLAGTDPQNARSLLQIEEITWDSNTGVLLHFTALSNKTYTVQSSPFVPGVPWSRMADVAAAPTNRTVVVSEPANLPSPRQRFYRLTTPRVP